MGMIDTAIRLGIALELVALYLLSCIHELRQAAQIMNPVAMQMCYLQALADVDSDENSTITFPLALELLRLS
jgi:hypothetical protein